MTATSEDTNTSQRHNVMESVAFYYEIVNRKHLNSHLKHINSSANIFVTWLNFTTDSSTIFFFINVSNKRTVRKMVTGYRTRMDTSNTRSMASASPMLLTILFRSSGYLYYLKAVLFSYDSKGTRVKSGPFAYFLFLL